MAQESVTSTRESDFTVSWADSSSKTAILVMFSIKSVGILVLNRPFILYILLDRPIQKKNAILL